MATEKITLSLDVDALDLARREARLAGVSLSAWLSQTARSRALAEGAARLSAWMRAHPERWQDPTDDDPGEELLAQWRNLGRSHRGRGAA